jgi:hypothetical protein
MNSRTTFDAVVIAQVVSDPNVVVSLTIARSLSKPWGAIALRLGRLPVDQRLRVARIALADWFEMIGEDLRPDFEAAIGEATTTRGRRPIVLRCDSCGLPITVRRRRIRNYCRDGSRRCARRAERARARAAQQEVDA